MSKFKLSKIAADAEVRFGDFVIEDVEVEDQGPVTLVHALRMTDEMREDLKNAPGLDDVETEEELVAVYKHWAKTVAKTPEQAEALAEAIGNRIDIWAELQVQWTTRTQPGEASTSES